MFYLWGLFFSILKGSTLNNLKYRGCDSCSPYGCLLLFSTVIYTIFTDSCNANKAKCTEMSDYTQGKTLTFLVKMATLKLFD